MNLGLGGQYAGPVELHGYGRFVLSSRDFEPAYLKAHAAGQLSLKAQQARKLLESCRLCPRQCGVNRLEGNLGVCKVGRLAEVASAFPHFGEEDCLRGWRGSGTIFFSGCNLRCVFCQNFDISQQGDGQPVSAQQLATLMLELQQAGCHNINFVTPSHVVPQLLEALELAVQQGLRLPLVYNSSGYDSLETLHLLDGVVDIYMPDFKLWDPEHCRLYLTAADYAEAARAALKCMHQQVGVLKVDEHGVALRGVLVRHLVMPGLLQDTGQILRWLARELSPDTFVNVMDQYRPAWKARSDPRLAAINRPLRLAEYEQAVELAQQAGLWRLDQRWR
jgi:putative pyruvate formate lyase activating enzyme